MTALRSGQVVAMAITHIKVVTVYVTDQQQALEFYTDKLGFELRQDEDMGPMGRWLTVAPPGSTEALVMLGDAASFEKTDRLGEFAPCTLECDDAALTREELAGRGVEVSAVESAAWGTHFYAKDQDGNNFLVRQADA